MKKGIIAIETANAGIVTITTDVFINWFRGLKKEDIKTHGFSRKQYSVVKKIIAQGKLENTYSPVVYDFILFSLNDLMDKGILKC
jgi:hypothetical protein